MSEYTFDRCTIYESFYSFAQSLPTDADRGIFYTKMIEYSLYDIEPVFESAILTDAFCLVKPTIDSSNRKRTNGKKPKNKQENKANGKQNGSKEQANGKQTANPQELEQEQEQELALEPEIKPGDKSPVTVFSFEQFWKAYGKAIDRAKCETKFKKIKAADRELIKDKLPGYIASTPDAQYRKNPLTWLNGCCWLDEVITEPTKPAFKEFGGINESY